MTEQLVKTLDLKNGLQLNVFDASRKLVGDRWLVSLIVRMEIPVTETLAQNSSEPLEGIREIKEMLGERVLFEQKRERNFIDALEKDAVFNELCDMFLKSTVDYLSKDIFPKQYILKTFKDETKKKSLKDRS